MATRAEATNDRVGARAQRDGYATGGAAFDWGMIAVSTWLVAGGFSDAWAHNHLPLDNFFTPWHATLYSGVLAVTIFLLVNYLRNVRRGYSWKRALPPGYGFSLIGAGLFILSGLGDMLWHIAFGIELSIDGALSPTHVAAFLSSVIVLSGPFRAAWKRIYKDSTPTLLALLPMLLSLLYSVGMITLISQFSHPFVYTMASDPQQDPFGATALSVVGILFQTSILLGAILLAIRRWRLPFGALTLLITLNIAMLSFMQDTYVLILPAFVAGLIADVLNWWLRPSIQHPHSLRLFSFAVPVALYLLYFLTLKLTSGVYWTIHLWLGTTLVAGMVGFMLSYLLLPPAVPGEPE